jgi:hypothetical protein
MAALQPDTAEPLLESVRHWAQEVERTTTRKSSSVMVPGRAMAPTVLGDFLLTELTVLLRQGKDAEASRLALERLRAPMRDPWPVRENFQGALWGVVPVRGLGDEVYAAADQCAAMLKTLDPASADWYELQVRSILALRRGRFEEAIKLASESDAEWMQKTERGLPDSAAVRACAFAHRGQWDKARTNLREAQLWARDRVYATPLIAEAVELIGDH